MQQETNNKNARPKDVSVGARVMEFILALLAQWELLVYVGVALGASVLYGLHKLTEETAVPLLFFITAVVGIRQLHKELQTSNERRAEVAEFERMQLALVERIELVGRSSQSEIAQLVTSTAKTNETSVEQAIAIREVREHLKNLANLHASPENDGALCNQRGFYVFLRKAITDCEISVDLTQLDPNPPQSYGINEKLEYFKLMEELVKTRPHVQFRRIVAIQTPEKLKWVIGQLQRVKDSPNFSLHYADPSEAKFFLPPLSLQIIDRHQLCMVDPTRGFLPVADADQSLWLKGKSVVQPFCNYYDHFWKKTSDMPIKEGADIYPDTLEKVVEMLRKTHQKEMDKQFPKEQPIWIPA